MKTTLNIDAFIGSRVRMRRLSLEISQEQLGDVLGLTFQQVQKYEKGQHRIGAGRLYWIAQALSVPVEYFFEGLPSDATRPDTDQLIERNAEVQAFIASPDGHNLALAFQRIDDPATRRRILELINSIASESPSLSSC